IFNFLLRNELVNFKYIIYLNMEGNDLNYKFILSYVILLFPAFFCINKINDELKFYLKLCIVGLIVLFLSYKLFYFYRLSYYLTVYFPIFASIVVINIKSKKIFNMACLYYILAGFAVFVSHFTNKISGVVPYNSTFF
ncbi:MAG TPA: hypothetical protein DHM37_00040, partial [Candidatus Cloacimonas sp.]|nr:hypothetical protein [Candidatus Cloacimonas sp.]